MTSAEQRTLGYAKTRSNDRLRRAERRNAAMVEYFDTYAADAGTRVQSNDKELTKMNDTTDAIAASRRRIDAGIAAFDRALAEKPVGLIAGIDTPDGLLDALGRSAVATAATDLAALAVAPDPTPVGADAPEPTATVVDGGELVAVPAPATP